jgi:hypothetical protein
MPMVVCRKFYFLQTHQFSPYSAILSDPNLVACLIFAFGTLFTFLMHYYPIINSPMFVGMVFGRLGMANGQGLLSTMDILYFVTPLPILNAVLGIGNQSELTKCEKAADT